VPDLCQTTWSTFPLRDQLTTIARNVSEVKADVAALRASSQQCEKFAADLSQAVYDCLKTTVQKHSSETFAIRTELNRDRHWIMKIAIVVGWIDHHDGLSGVSDVRRRIGKAINANTPNRQREVYCTAQWPQSGSYSTARGEGEIQDERY
jgi:hypothetical protein